MTHADLIEMNKVEFIKSKIDNAIAEVVTVINEEIVNKSKYKRHVPNNMYNS